MAAPAGTPTIGALALALFLDDKGFESALKGAEQAVQRTGDRMRSMATTLETGVATAFKAATAAAAAFTAASIAVGVSFEKQMAMVGALSGLKQTDEAFGRLTDKARQLGRDTMFTATQAGEALQQLAQAGMSVEESLIAVDHALYMAGATGASMEDSAGLLVATLRQFNLEADQSRRVTDVMSKSIRTSLLDFSSLREAMKYAGTAGAAFGYSLEETVAAVAQFRNLGLEGSQAGTNFRMALIEATKATDEQVRALARYGLTMADINPETHSFSEILKTVGAASMSATDAIQVFGVRAGANVAQLAKQVNEGKIDLDAYTQTLRDSAGQTGQMYQTMLDTTYGRWKILESSIQETMIELFGSIGAGAGELLSALTDVFNQITAVAKGNTASLSEQVGGTLGRLADWLRDQGPELAQAFVRTTRAAAALLDIVVRLVPYLGDAAIAATAIYAGLKAQALTAGILTAVSAVKQLAAGFQGAQTAALAANAAMGVVAVAAAGITAAMLLQERTVNRLEARGQQTATQFLREYGAQAQEASDQVEGLRDALSGMIDRQVEANRAWGPGGSTFISDEDVYQLRRFAAGVENTEEAVSKLPPQFQEQARAILEADREYRRLQRTVENYGTRVRVEKEAVEEAAKAEADATAETEARQRALDELMGELGAQAGAEKTTTEATDEQADALKEATDEADAMVDVILKMANAHGELLDALQAAAQASELLRKAGEWLRDPDGFIDPKTLDRLRALTDQVDALAPPTALSRVDQLKLLLAELELEAAKSAESAAALAESIGRVQEEIAKGGEKGPGWLASLGQALGIQGVEIGAEGDTLSAKMGGLVGTVLGIIDLIANLDDTLSSLAEKIAGMPDVVRRLPEVIGQLVDAVVTAIGRSLRETGELGRAVGEAIPGIVESLVSALVDSLSLNTSVLAIGFVSSVIRGLIDGFRGMFSREFWAELMRGFWLNILEMVDSLAPRLADRLADALGVPEGQRAYGASSRGNLNEQYGVTFGDTPFPIRTGLRGMTARFAPGDIVVAAQSVQGIASQIGAALAGSFQMPGVAASASGALGGGGSWAVSLTVQAEGEVLDRAVVVAGRHGRAPALQHAMTATRGIRTGIDPGTARRYGP